MAVYECKRCGRVCRNVFEMAYHSRDEHDMNLPMADFEKVLKKHITPIKTAVMVGVEFIIFALRIAIKLIALPGHMVYRWLQ